MLILNWKKLLTVVDYSSWWWFIFRSIILRLFMPPDHNGSSIFEIILWDQQPNGNFASYCRIAVCTGILVHFCSHSSWPSAASWLCPFLNLRPSKQGRLVLLSVVSELLVGGQLVSVAYKINQASKSVTCVAALAVSSCEQLAEACTNWLTTT